MRKDIRNVVSRSLPRAESYPPIVFLSKRTSVLNVNQFAENVQTGSEVKQGAERFCLLVSDECEVSACFHENKHLAEVIQHVRF